MLKIEGLTRKPMLENVSLSLSEGHLLAVVGPSGSGKTSLLRLIAGLERARAGRILWRDRLLDDGAGSLVPCEDRAFGMVFQDSALFPHLNVQGNVAFALRHAQKASKRPVRDQDARLEGWLTDFGLAGLRTRSPLTLSGGERQMVALARALASEPELLLLDEPFGQIDRVQRHSLISFTRAWINKNKLPAVLVTHDARDAVDLGCDRILLLDRGRVVEEGELAAVIHHPVSDWAKGFMAACFGGAV